MNEPVKVQVLDGMNQYLSDKAIEMSENTTKSLVKHLMMLIIERLMLMIMYTFSKQLKVDAGEPIPDSAKKKIADNLNNAIEKDLIKAEMMCPISSLKLLTINEGKDRYLLFAFPKSNGITDPRELNRLLFEEDN